jgi:hypothetical protein
LEAFIANINKASFTIVFAFGTYDSRADVLNFSPSYRKTIIEAMNKKPVFFGLFYWIFYIKTPLHKLSQNKRNGDDEPRINVKHDAIL